MRLDEIEGSIMHNMAELRVLKYKLAVNMGSSQLDQIRTTLDQIDNNLARNVDWLRHIRSVVNEWHGREEQGASFPVGYF